MVGTKVRRCADPAARAIGGLVRHQALSATRCAPVPRVIVKRLPEQALEKPVTADFQVLRHFAEQGGRGSNLERVVGRNGDVLQASQIARQSDMTAGLPCDAVADA